MTTDPAATPTGHGAYADIIDTGSIVFVAGQVGRPSGAEGESMDFRTEAIKTFQGVGAVLGRIGLSLGDVVRCTVYLTDFEEFAVMDEVFRATFPHAPPTRTTVGVSALARDCRIEVEATAARSTHRP